MTIRFFGFHPGRRINAMGEVADVHFALAAIGVGPHMDATVQFDCDDRTSVKLQLPNDVTEGDLPHYIRVALNALYEERGQAA